MTEEEQTTPGELDPHEVFQFLDEDGSGSLSKQELRKGLSILKIDLSATEFQAEIDKRTEEGEDVMNEEQFVKLLNEMQKDCPPSPYTDDVIRDIFGALDVDGSGKITKDEFKVFLQSCGDDPLNEDDIAELFESFDKDNDGFSQDELKKVLESLLQ